VQFYTDTFGQPPQGMWPAEGAVAQEIVNMVGNAGIQWMATDEEVLARSLGQTGFARNAQDTVQDAATLYRPYIASTANNQVYTLFRDKVISDKVGFTYSGTPGQEAARDFVDRILAIRETQPAGSVGDRPEQWTAPGQRDPGRRERLGALPQRRQGVPHEMYRLLEEEQAKGTIQTITPSDFIAQFPEQPKLDKLWAGSWVSPDYLTWIGEDEENRAWNVSGPGARLCRGPEGSRRRRDHAQMMDAIYTAEGSDWFWWYGADQNSGDDASFDAQFRATLAQVYELAGQPVPTFLKVPIIPETAQAPAAGVTSLLTPTIDGLAGEGEWEGAGYFLIEGGVQANPNQVASQLWYGFDKENAYLRLDARRAWADVGADTRVGFYLARPGGGAEQPFSRVSLLNGTDSTLLGFGANALAEVAIQNGAATATFYTVDREGQYAPVSDALPVGVAGATLELALPYELVGKPNAGDALRLRTVISEGEQRDVESVPATGPAELLVPDLGLTTPVLTIDDPEGDDHGPGPTPIPATASSRPRPTT
jgi:hypothetical protein